MSINVVYLAYFNEKLGYNLNVVENFLDSYKKRVAGIEHSLTIIVKNCSNKSIYNKLLMSAKKYNARVVELPDDGWDFGAYFRITKMIKEEYIFFCGGYVQILSDNWLLKLYNAFKNDGSVQLAGPMGSWGGGSRGKFPNPHIRTTAFMLKRDLFLKYISTKKFPVTKEDTYEIEHGKTSLTNFVLNKGYKVVVVDCDGKTFEQYDWDESKTFFYPNENKSLFKDKHTEGYDREALDKRENFERFAWGRSLKKTKVKIFVAYHKNEDEGFYASEVFQPIFNGAYKLKKGVALLRDNFGDKNISKKNSRYRELTGHYWIWKNLLPKLDTEYVGFFHYCRFLDFNLSDTKGVPFKIELDRQFEGTFKKYTEDNIMKCIDSNDVVVPEKFILPKSIYEVYLDSSPKEDLDMALDIIKEICPKYSEAAQKVLGGNELYANLIFVMKKELANEYMEWIFEILPILEERIDWDKYDESFSNSILVNIAEVLFNVWLFYSIEKKGLKVVESTSFFLVPDINNFLEHFKK